MICQVSRALLSGSGLLFFLQFPTSENPTAFRSFKTKSIFLTNMGLVGTRRIPRFHPKPQELSTKEGQHRQVALPHPRDRRSGPGTPKRRPRWERAAVLAGGFGGANGWVFSLKVPKKGWKRKGIPSLVWSRILILLDIIVQTLRVPEQIDRVPRRKSIEAPLVQGTLRL